MKVNRKVVLHWEAKQLGDPLDDVKSITFNRLSRESMAKGLLDQLGTEIFTTGKVRKVLDRLFAETPASFILLIRKTLADSSVTPSQIEQALRRIWDNGRPKFLNSIVALTASVRSWHQAVSPDMRWSRFGFS
jgi:hypothetical protein